MAADRVGPNAADAPTGEWPVVLPEPVRAGWRMISPELHAPGVVVREAQPGDASALLTLLSAVDVARVVSQRPGSLAELASRIEMARAERYEGRGVCLAVVPAPGSDAVGLFRVWEVEAGFRSAEWDFVIAPQHWGRGLFFRVAPLVVDFVFDVLGAERLETRAPIGGRSQGALRKLGAVPEALLRHSCHRAGTVEDETLWAILAGEWHHRTGRRAVH